MAFMVPYWISTILIALATLVHTVIMYETYDHKKTGKTWRNRKIVRNLSIIVSVILVFLGIWVPFFIPGLYG